MPDILKQLDDLKHLQPQKLLGRTLEIIEHCWELDRGLQQWYKEFKNQIPGPLYGPQFSADPELGKLFPVVLHFVDLQVAHVLSLYWAALVILVRILCYEDPISSSRYLIRAIRLVLLNWC
jgi:hypothetical protein